jgi:hypothetical protein
MGIGLSFSGWTDRLTVLVRALDEPGPMLTSYPKRVFALQPTMIKDHRQDGKKSPYPSRGRREKLAVASTPPSSNHLNYSTSYTSPHRIFFSSPAFSRDDLNAFQTTTMAVERFGVTELFSAAVVEPQVE